MPDVPVSQPVNPGCDAPVGVFDSGVGGLSVLNEIRQTLPNESLLYLADCGHIPYGEKTPEFIIERCLIIADFFHEQGAKALVVACNTATAAGVAHIRQRYPDWPIVGMEPAVKPAAEATRSGVVGVLATTGTLQSARFAALLDRFASDVSVVTQPCPGLVELIETGDLVSPQIRQLLQRYVEPLLAARCDTIILGCTHYPFLKPLLREMLPESVTLIDTGAAVARQLQRLLSRFGLLASGPARETVYWSSDIPDNFGKILPFLSQMSGNVRSFRL
ncbi:glutamate racemase [Pseudomonas syringae pv. actinidiae]|uniref:Glutamate racemase n=2 Tax=Pseudomonas syringae pv. actinidiae TaxID=103796 RepID=A0A2V0QQU1_PSESF|nr:glutamate racemase [Pseudomonas syringae]EPN66853.1 glutamate racemase [Pseudomonas syringae pv. actinidiae ICMP 19101]EPN70387.1 glutamate racemase [Pseudomonas syringae pv. actinidiae ICMP 19079]AKT28953.1 glutamate racemase [Pseudomonas syringae pv. actinidiae ICMP 18884]AOE55463.1 glutamate racemase [Pseudomonas syringae pv. actinidiae ICMP 18708]APP96322.1 glutamate racemase [Pseudomonas syringae pv. actinidiae]